MQKKPHVRYQHLKIASCPNVFGAVRCPPFGGRLKTLTGNALNYDVGMFFMSLGIRILQGYGQTEAAPVISVNLPENNQLDTVGPPLKNVEVRLAPDGEICVKGELVMAGYWNNAAATAQTLKDGWLHTGDIGEINADGFLRITDRKRYYCNSGGDTISPQKIEGMINLQAFNQLLSLGINAPALWPWWSSMMILPKIDEFALTRQRCHIKHRYRSTYMAFLQNPSTT